MSSNKTFGYWRQEQIIRLALVVILVTLCLLGISGCLDLQVSPKISNQIREEMSFDEFNRICKIQEYGIWREAYDGGYRLIGWNKFGKAPVYAIFGPDNMMVKYLGYVSGYHDQRKVVLDLAKFVQAELKKNGNSPTASAVGTFPYTYNPYGARRQIDKEPPHIELITPVVGNGKNISSKKKSITVRGNVTDRSGVTKISVNSKAVEFSSTGLFFTNIPLVVGENFIFIETKDANENAGVYTFTVIREQEAESPSEQIPSIVGSNYYALLIACQDYNNPHLQNLENPISDMTSLKNTLVTHYSFTESNVRILINPERKTIIKEFDLLSRNLDKASNLLVFFAGHGYWDDKFQQGYWLPVDASNDNRVEWISNSTIRDYIRGIDTKHTLLITDACFSGGIFKSRKPTNTSYKAVEELYKLPSRKAITSGTLNEVPDKSVFVEYLIKRLEHNTIKYLSSEELFLSFRQAVINNSPVSQVPQFGEIREAGDEGGDFIFIRGN